MGKEKTKEKSSRTGYNLITAILFILLGIVTIIFRGQVEGMIDNIIKWVVAGVFAIVAIVNIIQFAKNPGKSTIGDLILGAFALIALVILLVAHGLVIWIVGILFGLYLIYEGIMKISSSFKCKKSEKKAWFMLLIFGIISILAGAFLFWNTYKGGITFFVLYVGIVLIFAGIQNAFNVFVKAK